MNPIIINEYGWLWLNRDGSTTTLTDYVYPNAFGPDLSTEERLELYARNLGILTEYWRAHRKAAGVLHFCGLGYSRSEDPRGQTSDHFIDLDSLRFDPDFVTFVKPAFNPTGLFLNWFETRVNLNDSISVPVIAINDHPVGVSGTLTIFWVYENGKKMVAEQAISIDPAGKLDLNFVIPPPPATGIVELTASFQSTGEKVVSRRLCNAV